MTNKTIIDEISEVFEIETNILLEQTYWMD